MIAADVWSMTWLTVRVAATATLLSLPIAVAVGYFMARKDFPGKSFLQALIALPMVLPPVAVGLGLLYLLSPQGPLAWLWDLLGLRLAFTPAAAVLAASVVGFPLLERSCEQAFAAIPRRYEQVSRTLGRNPWATFFRVVLPLGQRGVLYGSLLAFTRALGEFGATALVAGILPGRTETLALGIYSQVQMGDDSAAFALCGVSFLLSLAALLAAEGWVGRELKGRRL
jgi:molybdate transport system permease protein